MDNASISVQTQEIILWTKPQLCPEQSQEMSIFWLYEGRSRCFRFVLDIGWTKMSQNQDATRVLRGGKRCQYLWRTKSAERKTWWLEPLQV